MCPDAPRIALPLGSLLSIYPSLSEDKTDTLRHIDPLCSALSTAGLDREESRRTAAASAHHPVRAELTHSPRLHPPPAIM